MERLKNRRDKEDSKINLKIRDFREDHDFSQQKVADYLHCDRSLYAKYERGERALPLEMAIQLADLYEISLDSLVGRTKPKKNT